MPSLADAIEVARSRKRMPSYAEGSTRDLARKLDVHAPISTQEVIRQLADLDPAGRIYKHATETGFVHAYADLIVQSDGATVFRGWAREEGLVGDHFLFTACMLDVRDAQGRALTFAHVDTLAGRASPGYSEKNWTDYAYNPIVADQWEKARASSIKWKLYINIDPLQITTAIIGGLLAVAGGIFIARKVTECPDGQKMHWEGKTVSRPRPEHPEDGSEYVFRGECR